MKTVVKILAVLVGVITSLMGILFVFNPTLLMEHAQLSASGNFRFSTVRELVGVPCLVAGGIAILAMLAKKYEFLHTSVFIFMAWTFGRIVSLIFDGFSPEVMANVGFSFVMSMIMIFTYSTLTKEQ